MPTTIPVTGADAAEIAAGVEQFIRDCTDPVLMEPGEDPLPLRAGSYAVEITGNAARLQAWDETRNIVRRIRSVSPRGKAAIHLEVERFGGRTVRVTVADRARHAESSLDRKAARTVLRERMRTFLRRQFSGWRIAEISSEADLEHSFSPAFPRAMVTKGNEAWAVITSPRDATAAGHTLTYGLLWLDYLRRRERQRIVGGLCLLLPAGAEAATCLRLRWLHPASANYLVFLYDSPEWEQQIEPARHGNLDTRIVPAPTTDPPPPAPGLPEAWLESAIRGALANLDARLCPVPVYGQVSTLAATDRGILDLLACDRAGRLAVIELKASADMHLPLQALDYWLRVHHHNEQGELAAHGYFSGQAIIPAPPRLLIAAPSFEFHSTTETVLRYLAPAVEVERIGLHVKWFEEFHVMFRLRGCRTAR